VKALRTGLGELAGLFVEDRLFALAIALWLALALGLDAGGMVPPPLRGALVFVGLAVILVAAVARAART